MELQLQSVFIIVSILTLLFVVRKIRKHKLNIDDALIWMIWSIFLLVLSIFPQIPMAVSHWLGFMSTSNFILCLFIFFLYILFFYQTITVSVLKEKNKKLIQKLSLKEYEEKK